MQLLNKKKRFIDMNALLTVAFVRISEKNLLYI